MRKFTTIFFALVLCVSAMVVIASAATNCTLNSDGVHDWTAWRTVDESGVQMRECACGTKEYKEPPHEHKLVKTEAVAPTCETEGNIAYWYCAGCDCYFTDAEGKYNTARLSCILPAAHDLEHVEAKEATCFEEGNIEYWYWDICGCAWTDELLREVTNLKNVILPVAHNIEHVEAKAPTCTEEGNIEYWYCTECGAAWTDELLRQVTNLMSVKLGATCATNAVYTAVKEATCTENGNAEYWYCANCDVYYADEACTIVTNAKNLVIPASCSYNAVHTAAKEATCYEEGNVEYWYCANCDVYYLDAECTLITNAKSVIIPAAHAEATHVAAKAPTCTEEGNIEYWYCEACGQAWLDEACTLNTNLMAVKLGATCATNAVYTAAKEATCYEEGNVEYWYCANCDVYYLDAECTQITNAKSVILPAAHVALTYVEAVEPTASTDGNVAYWYCAVCQGYWLDEDCTQITNALSVILPATGVAMNTRTEMTFKTVFEALAYAEEGDTIVMIADSHEENTHLVLDDGITLDLDVYDLYAKGMIGFAGSHLTADEYRAATDFGKLYVSDASRLVLSGHTVKNDGNVGLLPVWDDINNCYVMGGAFFSTSNYTLTTTEDAINFSFAPSLRGDLRKALFTDAEEMSDNGLSIVLRLTWHSGDGIAQQDFVYSSEFVSKFCKAGSGLFTFTLTGYDAMYIELSDLTITPMIVADNGFVFCGATVTGE